MIEFYISLRNHSGITLVSLNKISDFIFRTNLSNIKRIEIGIDRYIIN